VFTSSSHGGHKLEPRIDGRVQKIGAPSREESEMRKRTTWLTATWLTAACTAGVVAIAAAVGAAPGAAKKPASIRSVLLISVDGLHQSDLATWVADNPGSTLAQLTGEGTTFTNASTTEPSDSFPGMLSMVTGGTPKSTGVFYDDSYDRTLFTPAAQTPASAQNCTGAPGSETQYAENIDTNAPSTANGQTGTRTILNESIDPTQLPYGKVSGTCVPIMPNEFLRTNSIFSLAHAAGLRTAWSDKHPAYQILAGHGTPNSIDDLFTPEINADIIPNKLTDTRGNEIEFPLPNPTGDPNGYFITDLLGNTEAYDQIKVDAILNEIDGWNSGHTAKVGSPAIFGMNFQSVSVGEKVVDPILSCVRTPGGKFCSNSYVPGGYEPGTLAFTPQMSGQTTYPAGSLPNPDFAHGDTVPGALNYVDGALGQIVDELKAKGLMNSTEIIISAKHGQSPINPAESQLIGHAETKVLASNGITPAQVTDDDVALIWLADQGQTDAAVTALMTGPGQGQAHVQTVLSGSALAQQFGNPLTNSRTPDLIVEPTLGTIYSGSTAKVAEHGGFNPTDTHVAMLVVNGAAPRTGAAYNNDPVHTTQIAPTILDAFGLNPRKLDAVKAEGTTSLPGF
jgi:hypothetical protein